MWAIAVLGWAKCSARFQLHAELRDWRNGPRTNSMDHAAVATVGKSTCAIPEPEAKVEAESNPF